MQYENALALRTSLETGWRISDVLGMKPENINGRKITIVAQKTGKQDTKVVSIDLIKRLRQISARGWVFIGRFGNKPRTRQAVWKDVKKAARILEINGNIAPHSARKTYAVEDFRDNGLKQTQRDLQHDDVSTTMIYAFADYLDGFSTAANRASSAVKTAAETDAGATPSVARVANKSDGNNGGACGGLMMPRAAADYIADRVISALTDALAERIK